MNSVRTFLCALLLCGSLTAGRAADVVNNTANATTGQMQSALGLLAQAFDMGAEATRLNSITVRLQTVTGAAKASVQLWTGANEVPETLVENLGDTGDFANSSDQLYQVFSPSKPLLAANTRYWVVVESISGSGTFEWRNSNSATFTTAVGAALPSVSATQSSGGSWTPFGSGDFQIVSVSTTRLRVTTNAATGAGSLYQALLDAYAQPGADTITFDPALTGQTITPNAVLTIDQDVTIDAAGLAIAPTVSGGGTHPILSTLRTVVIKGLNFSGGKDTNGPGAIYVNPGGALTLERCTFSGNSSTGKFGGAIWTNGNNLTLRDCAFFNNTATAGGAIFANSGALTMTNCTLSGNTSTTGDGGFSSGGGGAIFSNCAASLIHCTIAGNTAGAKDGGGIYNASGRTLNLTNCIVTGNTTTGTGPDIGNAANLNLPGVNFIGELSGTGQSASATLLSGEATLAALGDYGGPTKTMPPLAGSPAIDMATVIGGVTTDQRGASRSGAIGSAPDLGAVELGQIVVNTTADENGTNLAAISLREAIAINTPFQAELIRFDPAVFTGATPNTNTISLGNPLADTSAITVSNRLVSVDARDIPAGVTIDDGTATNYRLFFVSNGSTLACSGLTLANGGGAGFSAAAGAILVNGRALVLTRCTLSGNQAGAGGAIANASPATLTHCTLSGNQATSAGGAISNASLLTLTHCTLTDNHTTGSGSVGGAMFLNGALNFTHCLIAGNTADSGPDIYNSVGTITPTGVNFIGDLTDSGLSASVTILTGDAQLDPAKLAAHGGPTKTIALLSGSPALNAASGSTATTDQRGFPLLGTADLGAYERQLGPIDDQTSVEDVGFAGIDFSVGQVGTLTASSDTPAVVPNGNNLQLGTSGLSRIVALAPAPDAHGSATITITDSLSGETEPFQVTFAAVNDAPVFTTGADVNVFLNAGAQTVPGWATGISAGPADESGQTLTFATGNDNSALFADQPAVAANGTLTFTPAAGVHGVATVTVTLSDNGSTLAPNVNTSAPQTFRIGVRLLNPESKKFLAAGGAMADAAPGASNNTVGLPGDAVLTSFQTPATDDTGDVAFIAKWSGTAGGKVAKGTGLFLTDTCLAVVGGDASAIGGAGAKWKSFSDPVVEGGKLACLAKLSTGATAVVCNFTGATLEKIALTGEQAADAGDAKFKKFTAVALRGGSIGFLAQLSGGTAANKITPANDLGVWFRNSGGSLGLLYRDGLSFIGYDVGSFVSFAPGDGSAGSGRGWFSNNAGPLALSLTTFKDKTKGIVFSVEGGQILLAQTGDAEALLSPPISGAKFAAFRLPALNDALQAAWYATMVPNLGGITKADAGGIFAVAGNFNGPLAPSALIAQLGHDAGSTNGKFSVLKDPVLAQDGALAFPATIKGAAIKGLAAKTLWWRPASGGAAKLLAQGGGLNGEPTDLPTGSQWKAFGSLAIASSRGPIFTATLVPKTGDATTATASGVWAMDFTGTLRTLFRTGGQIDVGQPGLPLFKEVKSFTLLKATVGNTGVTRSFNDTAQVVWLATFADKTQAIVRTEVP